MVLVAAAGSPPEEQAAVTSNAAAESAIPTIGRRRSTCFPLTARGHVVVGTVTIAGRTAVDRVARARRPPIVDG